MTALFQLMAQRGTQFDPTLYAFATSRNLPGDRGRALASWCGDVVHRAWVAGVSIVAGTDDLGSGPEGTLPNIHEELRLLVDRAGLPPAAAIRAATQEAARAAGVEETRGTITTGKAADLVVLSADPTADIRRTRDIIEVFRGGRRYARHPTGVTPRR